MTRHPHGGCEVMSPRARLLQVMSPPTRLTCIRIDPCRLRHASMLGVAAVPLFMDRSPQPMSSPSRNRKLGAAFCAALTPPAFSTVKAVATTAANTNAFGRAMSDAKSSLHHVGGLVRTQVAAPDQRCPQAVLAPQANFFRSRVCFARTQLACSAWGPLAEFKHTT